MQFTQHWTLVTGAAALLLACGGATEPAAGAPGAASHDETTGPSTTSDGPTNDGTPIGATTASDSTVGGTSLPDGSDPPLASPETEKPPLLGSCLEQPSCPWSTRAAMPDHRRGQAAVVIDGSIYLFGGEGAGDVRPVGPVALPEPLEPAPARFSAVRAYDPELDTWTEKAPLPHGLYVLTAHELGGKVYVFGGYGETGFDATVQEYDPASDSWQLREPLPAPRYIFSSAAVAGRAYVIGGHGPATDPAAFPPWDYRNSVDIFDPALGWSSGTPSPEPLAGGASCALDQRIFVFGGEVNNLTSVYDVASDSWTHATPSRVARNGHSCVRVGSAFYLIGGRDTVGSVDHVEKYDPAADTWQTLDPMPTARQWFGAAALGEEIFVLGGDQEPSSTTPPNYSLSNAIEVFGAE